MSDTNAYKEKWVVLVPGSGVCSPRTNCFICFGPRKGIITLQKHLEEHIAHLINQQVKHEEEWNKSLKKLFYSNSA